MKSIIFVEINAKKNDNNKSPLNGWEADQLFYGDHYQPAVLVVFESQEDRNEWVGRFLYGRK